jgi:hypothetical protein
MQTDRSWLNFSALWRGGLPLRIPSRIHRFTNHVIVWEALCHERFVAELGECKTVFPCLPWRIDRLWRQRAAVEFGFGGSRALDDPVLAESAQHELVRQAWELRI